jgi:hypothetical protein
VRFCSDGDLTARELLFEKRVLADRFLANVTHDYGPLCSGPTSVAGGSISRFTRS